MNGFEDFDLEHILEQGFNVVAEEIDLAQEEAEAKKNEEQTLFPILPVRNMVMFPNVIVPITAGRKQSKQLLKEAQKEGRLIGILSQINSDVETPTKKDLYAIGTLGRIVKIINLPEGNITAIVKGVKRFKLKKIINETPYLEAEIVEQTEVQPSAKEKDEYEAIVANIKSLSQKIVRLDPDMPNAANIAISNISDNGDLLSFICTNGNFPFIQKQQLLEIKQLMKRASTCFDLLQDIYLKLELRNKIQQQTNKELDKHQREYYLNQQIKTIQEELGGGAENDADEFRKKAQEKKWSDAVQKHFEKELNRLQRHHSSSPDYNVQRNYLDFFIDLPWEHYSQDIFDIPKAQKILDKVHYGLEDIKKRILEHIAVLKLKNNMKSPILCLVGPPGVGKTSLGQSIADALGRKYIRVSLGGLHDESEIRGHRKTYIGAMAGRILQSIRKAGTSNPVVVLDEIDKIGQGVHGDPSSALLEVLDPEQNHAFYDNFLEFGYDLSKVMFIATANTLSTIQSPLLDRMEIIQIAGYTLEEKIEIAKRHLVKKQQEENGLNSKSFKLGNAELKHIIDAHTSESGVRTLDKQIAKVARWVALQIAMENEYSAKISIEKIDEILGIPRPKNLSEISDVPGVVTGLAWTRVGGDILFIESILSAGKGQLSMTGNLGNVMKESTTIALEYIKAKHADFGIDKEIIEKNNIHIHIPEGATPKDGPSAGIAMLTSMVSSFTGKKVRPHLAMTGEITLRGKVLPVGGIKEKLLAAARAGIKEVILCEANRKDVEDIRQDYLKNLKIHYVNKMSEVIDIAIEA